MERNIYDMTREELAVYFSTLGASKAKADFLFRALYGEGFDTVFGISQSLKKRLVEDFSFSLPTIVERREDDTACKLLLKLADGNTVETVRMKEPYGDAVCVSTQVGCNMGCAFCESGRLKKVRDLTVGEMTAQVLLSARDAGGRIYSVTLMGIGEPFDNYDNVLTFTQILTDPYGLNIAPRRVTISTAGLVPGIERFCDSGTKCNLAVSLHAPNDRLRSQLMPVGRKYPLAELMKSIRRFSDIHNRRVTMEYVMLEKVNDSVEHAAELAALLQGVKGYVNIIPYNKTDHLNFSPSSFEQIMAFYDVLKKSGISVTMRRRMGSELNAACGQLRSAVAEQTFICSCDIITTTDRNEKSESKGRDHDKDTISGRR